MSITNRLLSLCNMYPQAPVGDLDGIIICAAAITSDILRTKDSIEEQQEMIKTIEDHIKVEYIQGNLFN